LFPAHALALLLKKPKQPTQLLSQNKETNRTALLGLKICIFTATPVTTESSDERNLSPGSIQLTPERINICSVAQQPLGTKPKTI